MTRTLLLAMAVLGVATALAIGSYTALAGSNPVGDVAGAVIGADGPDDGDDVVAHQEDGEGEPEMVGAEAIAEAIAEQFEGVDAKTVLELHADGNGFGKLYHAYLIAAASGGTMTVEDVLAAAATAAPASAFFASETTPPRFFGTPSSPADSADTSSASSWNI